MGNEAFDREIENEQFVGSPTLTVDRLVEGGEMVVAIGTGEGIHTGGALHRFAFCVVITFASDAIRRAESYVIPLNGGA